MKKRGARVGKGRRSTITFSNQPRNNRASRISASTGHAVHLSSRRRRRRRLRPAAAAGVRARDLRPRARSGLYELATCDPGRSSQMELQQSKLMIARARRIGFTQRRLLPPRRHHVQGARTLETTLDPGHCCRTGTAIT